jgi:hypothetical protein
MYLILIVSQYELFDEQVADLEECFHRCGSFEWHREDLNDIIMETDVGKHALNLRRRSTQICSNKEEKVVSMWVCVSLFVLLPLRYLH